MTLWNPRDFTTDPRKTVDDRPFGGGPGMVMMAEPLEQTIIAAKQRQQQAGLQAGQGDTPVATRQTAHAPHGAGTGSTARADIADQPL